MSLIRPIALTAALVCSVMIAHVRAEEPKANLPWQGPAAEAAKANALRAPTVPATTAVPARAGAPPAPVPAQRPDLIGATGIGTTIAAPPATAARPPVAPAPAVATPPPTRPGAVTPLKADAAASPAAAVKPASKAAEAKADPVPVTPAAKADAKPDVTVDPKAVKVEKKKAVPAKQFFGMTKVAAPLTARAIGWYAKGCLAGAKPISIDGPAWQVMRLSRNRNWGHPKLIALVERLASESRKANEWRGLLIGDISQPRGGPMITGHKSHQVGLDADIWLTPMPDRRLTEKEREDLSATSMLAADGISVDPKVFGDGQIKLLKRAASYPGVERLFVHPAIKKALCEAAGTDRGWLGKVRPIWGHHYHFHIRMGCPDGQSGCRSQPPPNGDDGCGAEIKDWIKLVTPKKEAPPTRPQKPSASPAVAELTMKDLPPECATVLAAGGNKIDDAAAAAYRDTSKDAGEGSKSVGAVLSAEQK